jgi:hypothetical protein
VFDVLPWVLRWAEARRVLALDQVRAETAKTRLYTSFLPWEEADRSDALNWAICTCLSSRNAAFCAAG